MRDVRQAAALAVLAILTSDGHMPQPLAAPADVSDVVPPLPPPSGSVVRVSSEAELQLAVTHLVSEQTIVIAPGTYKLTKTLYIGGRPLTNVGIRGAAERRDAVTLVGSGMTNHDSGATPFGIWTGNGVSRLLIANMTIRDFAVHPLIFNPGTQSPRVYNVALIDGGEQLLKSNPTSPGSGVDNGIVEHSLFMYSSTSRDDYTNAIDVHAGANWTIRHNWFVNIRAPLGQLAGPAILMWRGSSGTTVDSNTFVNCQREISFGLEPTAAAAADQAGGIIVNNMIARDSRVQGDAAILLAASPGTQVVHNTILIGPTYPNAIEYRFANTTHALVANNLTDARIVARDGARATLRHNIVTADRSMFVKPATGDLHLLRTAPDALASGTWEAAAAVDWDGQTRPMGLPVSVGADEPKPSEVRRAIP